MIYILSVLALLVDYYIYRRVISRHDFGKLWKIGYIVYAVIVDTMVITSLIAYWSVCGDTTMLKGIMWVIGLFFLNTLPKFIYAVISLGDYLVQLRTKKVSHYFGYTGTFFALCAAGIMIYGLTIGRKNIKVNIVELEFPGLPASFDGFTVAHFSDVHLGSLIKRNEFLTEIVKRVNDLEPDIVVNSGDLVNIHYRELDNEVAGILGDLKSKYGIYSVMGNHDLGIYIKDTVENPVRENMAEIIARQEAMGWTVLRNASVYLSNGTDSIVVSGLDYPIDHKLNGVSGHSARLIGADLAATYEDIPDTLFNIAITHAPQLWNELLEASRGDLTVAGHVHAMQFKFKLGKTFRSPAEWMYDRWSGLYEEEGRYLYINDGIGYVMYPMRIGTKPEITLYKLRSRAAEN